MLFLCLYMILYHADDAVLKSNLYRICTLDVLLILLYYADALHWFLLLYFQKLYCSAVLLTVDSTVILL